MTTLVENFKIQYNRLDSRYTVTLLLLIYNILGITVLGFNRSPMQILLTVALGVLLHIFYDLIFNKELKFNINVFVCRYHSF